MNLQPFSQWDEKAFPTRLPLRGILANDCRLLEVEPGDVVMRQGEYGGSVFLVLEGEVTATLANLPPGLLGNRKVVKKNWKALLSQLWNGAVPPERRQRGAADSQVRGAACATGTPKLFVQDFPQLFEGHQARSLAAGQMFGETSALTRSPRHATVVVTRPGQILEIRWQGLRDLLQFVPSLRHEVNEQYRSRYLFEHLRETPIFSHLNDQQILAIAEATEFISFGTLLWTGEFRSQALEDIATRIAHEPLIVEQGDYVNGLILIRAGFARVTRKEGVGEKTVEYLGKGRAFGLREIWGNFRQQESRGWRLSLRATGYTDVLRIPVAIVEKHLLPELPESLVKSFESKGDPSGVSSAFSRRSSSRTDSIHTKLMESLVEKRLINGTQAMVIDLDRCTRCDDCVRACATSHDNNPRFVREGQILDNLMIANACMQCLDPVCMIGCPTGAIARESNTGVITINEQTCIGCQTCANNCPYQNIKMVAVRDEQGRHVLDQESQLPILQATKCDMCIDQPVGPACQRACPHDALIRLDLTTPWPLNEWIQG